MTQFDKDLDVRGLNCPLPILRAKKALSALAGGQVLRVLATDPGSVKDFQAFAKQTGNQLLSHEEADKVFTFFMKKKSGLGRGDRSRRAFLCYFRGSRIIPRSR